MVWGCVRYGCYGYKVMMPGLTMMGTQPAAIALNRCEEVCVSPRGAKQYWLRCKPSTMLALSCLLNESESLTWLGRSSTPRIRLLPPLLPPREFALPSPPAGLLPYAVNMLMRRRRTGVPVRPAVPWKQAIQVGVGSVNFILECVTHNL